MENIEFEKHVLMDNAPVPWNHGCIWRVQDTAKNQSLWIRFNSVTSISKHGMCVIQSPRERQAFNDLMTKMHQKAVPASDHVVNTNLCVDVEYMSLFVDGCLVTNQDKLTLLKECQLSCLTGITVEIEFVWQTTKGVGVKICAVHANVHPCYKQKCKSCNILAVPPIAPVAPITPIAPVAPILPTTQPSRIAQEPSRINPGVQKKSSSAIDPCLPSPDESSTLSSWPISQTKKHHHHHHARPRPRHRKHPSVNINININSSTPNCTTTISFQSKCRIHVHTSGPEHCVV